MNIDESRVLDMLDDYRRMLQEYQHNLDSQRVIINTLQKKVDGNKSVDFVKLNEIMKLKQDVEDRNLSINGNKTYFLSHLRRIASVFSIKCELIDEPCIYEVTDRIIEEILRMKREKKEILELSFAAPSKYKEIIELKDELHKLKAVKASLRDKEYLIESLSETLKHIAMFIGVQCIEDDGGHLDVETTEDSIISKIHDLKKNSPTCGDEPKIDNLYNSWNINPGR